MDQDSRCDKIRAPAIALAASQVAGYFEKPGSRCPPGGFRCIHHATALPDDADGSQYQPLRSGTRTYLESPTDRQNGGAPKTDPKLRPTVVQVNLRI